MLRVNSSKTFDEVLTEQPNIYNGVDGYAWNNDTNRWENVGITNITKELIEEWFGLRTVCHDEHFARYFRRKLNSTALRYAQLSRIELSAFDPLVANYVEREILASNSKTSAGTLEKTGSGTSGGTVTNTSTRTPDLTETIEGETSGQHSLSKGGSDTVEHDGTRSLTIGGRDTVTREGTRGTEQGGSDITNATGSHTDEHKEMGKQSPQSIAYAGAIAGTLPNLDWQYATAQGQSKDDHTETSQNTVQHGLTEDTTEASEDVTAYGKTESGSDGYEDTTTYGGTESGSQSGTDSKTIETTGTETTEGSTQSTGTHSDSVEEERTGTETGEGQTREIMTGRSGLTPQEAFSKAVIYLRNSSAWDWLRGELEECFLSIYDI